jgi:hypothetical protein
MEEIPMTNDLERRRDGDTIWKINAAYTDSSKAQAVVGDLIRAGMPDAEVTVSNPWPIGLAPARDIMGTARRHLVASAMISGLFFGLVLSATALLWAAPGQWLIYGAIGFVVGAAVSGPMIDALTAASPPRGHERRIGDPLGAVTVEVTATEDHSADVARQVIAGHDPALVQMETEPGPKPPSQNVLWEHEDGLSPLEELGSWLGSREERATGQPEKQRGRHLAAERARG